jgi:diguanylate cyclase (GGDEF)-like protein
MAEIHDFTKLTWGKDFTLDAQLAGILGTMTGQGRMEVGDFITLLVQCHVTDIEHYENTSGLWRAEVCFVSPEVLDRLPETTKFQLLQYLVSQLGASLQKSEIYQQVGRLLASDSITQVASWPHLNQQLQQEWQRMIRENNSLSLLFCEIDGAESYRKSRGTQVYHQRLQQIAQAINASGKRASDVVARYQEATFALLLPNTPAQGAVYVAQEIQFKVQASISEEETAKGNPPVTVSIGVATFAPTHGTEPSLILDATEQALHEAKAAGGDRICSIVGL